MCCVGVARLHVLKLFLEDNNPDVLKSKLTSSLSDIVVIDSWVIRSFNRIKFAVFRVCFYSATCKIVMG